MRSSHIIIAVILLVLIAGGGGAAYFFLAGDAPPKIVEFIGQQQRVLADGDAVDAPHDGATVIARLQKDMLIDAVGVVDGDKWVQVTLPDKRTAYFAISDLGPKPAGAVAPTQTASQQPATQTAALPQTSSATPGNVAPQAGPTDQGSSPGQTGITYQPTGPTQQPTQPTSQPGATQPIEEAATVEFDEIASVYTVTKPVPVYIEPNIHAPQKYEIEPGTSVPAIQRSKDGVWVMASTEDGDPAYLLVADLGPEEKGKAVAGAEAGDPSVTGDDANAAAGNGAPDNSAGPDTIDGKATVVTTGDLQVNGQDVVLAGVQGEGSPYVEQLQKLISGQGGSVHCVRLAAGYQCKMSNGLDVALSALFNGGARPTPDAPDTYQNQAKAAQNAHRGVWH
jgi:hypothetical protein